MYENSIALKYGVWPSIFNICGIIFFEKNRIAICSSETSLQIKMAQVGMGKKTRRVRIRPGIVRIRTERLEDEERRLVCSTGFLHGPMPRRPGLHTDSDSVLEA